MKVLHFLCLTLFSQTLLAQIVFEKTLSEAFTKAKKEGKIVFVKYYNSDCPVCKSLELQFQDKQLSGYYNQNFVSYALDTKDMLAEDKLFLQGANLSFTSVPFLLFFDADRNFLHYSHIQLDSRFLLEVAQNALTPSERTINLAKKYEAGDRSIRTLYAYNNFLQVQKQDDLARKVAKDLYDNFPKKDLATKKSFIITRDCVNDVDNGFFQFWINNMEKAAEFFPMTAVKRDLGEIISKSIYYSNRPVWTLEKIAKVKSYILLTGLSENPDSFFWQEESRVLVEQKREREALTLGKKMFDSEVEAPGKIFMLQHFTELCKEKESIRELQKWLKSLEIDDTAIQERADCFYIELVCFKKLKDKANFRTTYNKAKEFYQKNKIDTKDIDALKR